MKFLLNLCWFLVFGWWLSALSFIAGAICFVTVIGAPLGVLCFMFGWWIAWPFGRSRLGGGGNTTIVINNK